MKTNFEFTSAGAKTDLYKYNHPDAVESYSSAIEHPEHWTDEDLLETIFCLCNHGSPKECPIFSKLPMPSLSVGDAVQLGQGDSTRVYECAGAGWTSL